DGDGTFLCETGSDAKRALARVRSGSIDALVRAIDLSDGREVLLPAERVFPMLRRRRAARIPCGTSAACDWRGALVHGLLQHSVRLTVAGLASRRGEIMPIRMEEYDWDPVVHFLAAMVRAAGVELDLADVTGPLGVPVVACRSSSGSTVYGGGSRLVDA